MYNVCVCVFFLINTKLFMLAKCCGISGIKRFLKIPVIGAVTGI